MSLIIGDFAPVKTKNTGMVGVVGNKVAQEKGIDGSGWSGRSLVWPIAGPQVLC